LGGVRSDRFGLNGRLIGLIASCTAEQTLGDLTYHVRSKIDRLTLTLEAKLDTHSVWRLPGLLGNGHRIKERIEDFAERVDPSLEAHRNEPNLLETLPGIDRPTARAIEDIAGQGHFQVAAHRTRE